MLGLIKDVLGIVDRVVPDSQQKERLKAEITLKALEVESQSLEVRRQVLTAETGGTWLQRSWRPILMLTITGILVFSYFIDPIIAAIIGHPIAKSIPPQMWQLLTVAVGGYVLGRSGEKIAEKLK